MKTINSVIIQFSWGRGEVWSSRLPVTQEVAGSNPVVPAIRPDSSVGRALV